MSSDYVKRTLLAAEVRRRGVRAERFTLAQVWSRLYRQ